MAEAVYIFILVGLIPFFSWQQREEGRNLVSALVTGIFLILWLVTNTLPFVWDTTTIAVFCFAIWVIASIFWTNSRQSDRDIYTMLCCLVVFLVSRRLELSVLLPVLFIPGLAFAILSLYYRIIPKQDGLSLKLKWPIFGNSNHVGSFLLIPLFVGLWLSFNVSWLIFPLTLVIGLALALNQCRGAHIAAITGLLFIACSQNIWMLLAVPVLLIVAFVAFHKNIRSLLHRCVILFSSILLIKKAPLFGHGMRTFRREYPNIVPELLNNKLYKALFANEKTELTSSHRIHNDFLEIVFELGIIGLILFVMMFASPSLSWENYFFAGAVIAVAVHGLCFFPLRECHTAFPFFALAGSMAGISGEIISINPFIAIVLALIIARLAYGVFVKLVGLLYYDYSFKINIQPNVEDEMGKKQLEIKQAYLNRAIQCDPYNNIYLTEGYYYNVFYNPEIAFQYASRCFENYDGGKVKWGVADQYARALIRLGGFGVAKMAGRYALRICPEFKQTHDLMGQIRNLEAGK